MIEWLQESTDGAVVDISWLAQQMKSGAGPLTGRSLRSAQVVMGHYFHQYLLASAGITEPVVLATVLRHPWDRAISLCAHTSRLAPDRAMRPTTIQEYSMRKDPICHFILRRFPGWDPREGTLDYRTSKVLEQFTLLAMVDELGKGLLSLSQLLGLPSSDAKLPTVNMAPVRQAESIEDRIRENFSINHQNDITVYQRVRSGNLVGTGRPIQLLQTPSLRQRALLTYFLSATLGRTAYQAKLLSAKKPRTSFRTFGWLMRNTVKLGP